MRTFTLTCAVFFAVTATNLKSLGEENFWIVDPPQIAGWHSPIHWSLDRVPGLSDVAIIDNGGRALITAGVVDVKTIRLGETNFGNLRQSFGDVISDNFEIGSSSNYGFLGGSLTIRHTFDLHGTIDITSSFGAMTAGTNAVIDLSQGTIPTLPQ